MHITFSVYSRTHISAVSDHATITHLASVRTYMTSPTLISITTLICLRWQNGSVPVTIGSWGGMHPCCCKDYTIMHSVISLYLSFSHSTYFSYFPLKHAHWNYPTMRSHISENVLVFVTTQVGFEHKVELNNNYSTLLPRLLRACSVPNERAPKFNNFLQLIWKNPLGDASCWCIIWTA